MVREENGVVMVKKFIPLDNAEMRRRYEPRYGVCGPAVIAVLQNKTVKEIIDRWVI